MPPLLPSPPRHLLASPLQRANGRDEPSTLLPRIASAYSPAEANIAVRISPDQSQLFSQRGDNVHRLYSRQSNGPYLPYTYDYSGPSPGALAGIVLGVVGGILLIILLFWVVFAQRKTVIIEHDAPTEISYRTRRTRSSRRRRRHTSRTRTHRSEMSERAPSPPPPPRRRSERIIVEETRRTVSRPPPPPPDEPEPEPEPIPMPPSPVHERRVEGDDVVEVIEEESELSSQPRPSRRKSGYRTVDPNAYGGGNYASHSVHDSDRRRSSRRR